MEDQKRSLEVAKFYEQKLSDFKDDNKQKLSELRDQYQQILSDLEEENQQKLLEMQQEVTRRIAELRTENDDLRLMLHRRTMANERLNFKKWRKGLTIGNLRDEVKSLTEKLKKSEDKYKETDTLREDLCQSREEVRTLTNKLKKSEEKYKEMGEELKAMMENRENGTELVAGKRKRTA